MSDYDKVSMPVTLNTAP